MYEYVGRELAGAWQPRVRRRGDMRLPIIVLTILLSGCATLQGTLAPPMLTFPDRTIEEWSVGAAITEAEQDIKRGSFMVYLSGTIAAYPPGIPSEEYELIRGLPMADAGMGCVIDDGAIIGLRI